MKKSNFSVYGAVCLAFGIAISIAALALRCVQVFKYTDFETAHIVKSASGTVSAFYVFLAASVILFSFAVVGCKPFPSANRKGGKTIFAL